MQQFAGNLAVQRLFQAGAIQAKLSISQPNDPDEQEADRVADQVMRMAEPGPISSAPGVIHRKCAPCEAGETTCPKCEEEEKVRRKEKPDHAPQVGRTAHAQISALRGGGQPLPTSVRAFFEPRFDADFSQVRLHTNSAAAEAARAIQAKAFTAGQDVAFAAGEYVPDSAVGRKLLAHELTHTLQQKNGASLQSAELISQRDDPAEREADAMADTLVQHGAPVAVVQGQPVPAVQRDLQPGAGGQACAAAPEDFSRVSGAEALQGQIAGTQTSSDPIASLEVLKKVWMTYGHEATGIYVRELLKLMWARGGQASVDQFADRFVFRINLDYGSPKSPDDTDAVLARLIRDIVERDKKNVHTEAEQFLTCYEGQAREAAKGAVDESKERVLGEFKHYFGSYHLFQTMFGTEDSRDFEEDEASRKGLGIAAAGLSRRRKALISANAEYRAAVGNTTMLLEVREPIEQAHARASEDYEVFRTQVVAAFPILEAVSSPGIHPWDNQERRTGRRPGATARHAGATGPWL